MTTFQLSLLTLGVLLGASVFWDQIKSFFMKVLSNKNDQQSKLTGENNDSLSEVIVCWENLQDELRKRGLKKAVDELTKIFPLFIEAVKEETPNAPKGK